MLLILCLPFGCGKKEPAQPSASDLTTPSHFEETKAKAEAEDADAEYNLGVMYERGQGVEQDFKEAVKWYRKAAEQGDAVAQYNLGLMYRKGEGVPQDFKEALKWFRKAAEQGNELAQYSLGMMYDNGEGVPIDRGVAYVWCSIAAAKGYTEAATWKDNTAKKMTPAQIAKAEELVKEMIKKNPKLLNSK